MLTLLPTWEPVAPVRPVPSREQAVWLAALAAEQAALSAAHAHELRSEGKPRAAALADADAELARGTVDMLQELAS
ncbi:hypothetical protein EAH89_17155 [Roseomonas nepalensis]|uniref:Uncharacterized protein n=1 Tax=Muricoccus nepalensis TaxID=1854500 RepID=A0A502FUF6_9PROT|nr:hypothetical protein [Roseomonas nepalensis]TPG53247.1 hypothetical protein EAH89_17155 [Roseomonas nepalensis]